MFWVQFKESGKYFSTKIRFVGWCSKGNRPLLLSLVGYFASDGKQTGGWLNIRIGIWFWWQIKIYLTIVNKSNRFSISLLFLPGLQAVWSLDLPGWTTIVSYKKKHSEQTEWLELADKNKNSVLNFYFYPWPL